MNNWTIDDIKRDFGKQQNAEINIIARKKSEESERTYTFVMSDEVMDRHGTIVKLSGADIEQYNRNPIVAIQHQTSSWLDYDLDNIVGKGRAFFEDGLLKNEITFEPKELNAKAEKLVGKIDFGSINAGSIGFIPKSGGYGKEERGEDPDIFYIREWTLLEYSIVTVPSNPNALVEKMKPLTEEEMRTLLENTETVTFKTLGLEEDESKTYRYKLEKIKEASPSRERAKYKLRYLKLRK